MPDYPYFKAKDEL